MHLDRTVIIPSTPLGLARQLLQSLIHEQDVLLIIVLGASDKAQEAVKRADVRARVTLQGFERKVGWILKPSLLDTELRELKDLANADLTKVTAIALSLDDEVKDIVKEHEEVNFIRMEMAFLRAGVSDV